MATPDHFEIARVILHTDGNVVSWLHSSVAENVAQLDGALMELSVSRHLAGLGLDDGGTIGMGRSVNTWVHVPNLVNGRGWDVLGAWLALASDSVLICGHRLSYEEKT